MTEKQIEYILAIDKYKSISKAADYLGISQPYLSQFLSNIESTIGYKLFDRSAYPILITPFGKAYVETAKQIQNLERDLNNTLVDLSDSESGKITIAIAPHAGYGIMPAALQAFNELFPRYRVTIITSTVEDYTSLLKTGAADFIVTAKDLSDASIGSRSTKGAMLIVAAPAHYDLELEGGKNDDNNYPLVDLEKLSKVPFIQVRSDGGIISERIAEAVSTYHDTIEKNTIIECDSYFLCAELIQKGLGASVIPSTCIAQDLKDSNTKYYSIPSVMKARNIHVYYRKNAYFTKAMDVLIDIIIQTIHISI